MSPFATPLSGALRALPLLCLLLLTLGGCRGPHPLVAPVGTVLAANASASAPLITQYPVRFTDVSAAAGIHWSYTNGATGQHLFVETTGGGVALLDYNGDGLLDLFAPQGGAVPGAAGTSASAPRNVLYRNNGDGTFTDVTQGSGLDAPTGYGQGVAVGDFDNDGCPDLYVTAYGGSHLFRNRGDGTFTDVTARAGLGDADGRAWPLSAAWGDYDRDGRLDLFVCHYAGWSPETNHPCRTPNGQLGYCRPQVYEGSSCRLYHNNGDGTFTDVTARSGIGKLSGKSMGVAWVDYDEDGWPDLFVTNDTLPNFLLHNNRDGTFADQAMLAGVAVGASGSPMSGMGIGVGDYDNDGHPDLFDTNFSGEPKGAWRNEGHGMFADQSFASNLASTNLQFLGFGMELCDYDLDGFRDLIIGNGHVLDDTTSLGPGASYAQSQQLFHNGGNRTFTEDLRSLGDLVHPRVTRGLAVGDVDNDGDPDVVMVAQNGPLQLFRNDGGNRNHWITFRLEGTRSNRSAIGAKITLRPGDLRLAGWVPGGSSFCSASDQRVTFGLRNADVVREIEVRWPSGQVQKLGSLPADRFYWLREGGAVVPDPRCTRRR